MKKDKIVVNFIHPGNIEYYWELSYIVNYSKLYHGCSRSKYSNDKIFRSRSFDRKVEKCYKSDTFKTLGAAKRAANKLSKLPEIKKIYLVQGYRYITKK